MGTQREIGPGVTQPGRVERPLQRREQPFLVLDAEPERQRDHAVGGDRLAHLQPGTPGQLMAADREANLDQESLDRVITAAQLTGGW